MHQPIEPEPDQAPDPGAIFCGCCPAHLGRWRIGDSDVLVCATCDTAPPLSEHDPTTKETP